ncbi:MAG TPA: phosphoribosylformylglycinamidine synthase [Acidimicrobiaceae bacterium]|nr:phosphoribosylformylglycinamidine synthase [Acidimicrobiaceae bacterium]HAX04966.1 phosphoribosylformylglycinamidine synthase [Acidimicrobiaceae bacterium]|tara:strand:+ start:2365 stop:2616 length:252 start_codon:yes stop_codon:yes gene_type:complete
MRFEAKIEVSPRDGIANPEGSTIERALPALGFEMTHNVRVGKLIRLEVEAESVDAARLLVEDMCSRFLTNPVIEDASVEVLEI